MRFESTACVYLWFCSCKYVHVPRMPMCTRLKHAFNKDFFLCFRFCFPFALSFAISCSLLLIHSQKPWYTLDWCVEIVHIAKSVKYVYCVGNTVCFDTHFLLPYHISYIYGSDCMRVSGFVRAIALTPFPHTHTHLLACSIYFSRVQKKLLYKHFFCLNCIFAVYTI